nr:hypothetical protein [Tanacetum cinerariifolium]
AEIDIDSLNEAIRLSISTQRSIDDLEAQQTMEKVQEHNMDEELDQLMEDAPSSSDKEKLKELMVTDLTPSSSPPSSSTLKPKRDHFKHKKNADSFLRIYMSNNILHVHPTQASKSSTLDLQYQLDHEDHHNNDAHHKGERNAKRQKTSEHGTYSMDLLEEILKEVDEAKMHKAVNDMLRQRCNSCEEHQYHEDQMLNYLKSDIVLESKKEDFSLQLPKKPALVYHRPNKYTLLLHKYPIEPFPKDDIKERTSRWERVYDFHLGMESYQQKVNLTASTITFPGIEKKKQLTKTSKPVVGLIYENSKKEKRVMILKEIPKFCDATLKRVLEMVKKYNKDVKYGYADPRPTDADSEYLEFYKEYC